MQKVSVFHIGPQKSATTWLYHCFKEHPEVQVGKKDSLNFFNMEIHNGMPWYLEQFECPTNDVNSVKVDMTPGYMRSTMAPERIFNYNSESKIILCIREPVSRAFSHYWHSKKKSDIDIPFELVFKKPDCFANWVEVGYYDVHIKRYLELFPRTQLHIQYYDELLDSPADFLKKTFSYMGVDNEFSPAVINRRINRAKPKRTKRILNRERFLRKIRVAKPANFVKKNLRAAGLIKQLEQEQLSDVDRRIIDALLDHYEPHTIRLEKLLDIDLSHWRDV